MLKPPRAADQSGADFLPGVSSLPGATSLGKVFTHRKSGVTSERGRLSKPWVTFPEGK